MAKLKNMGAGYDNVASLNIDAALSQAAAWLNSSGIFIPSLAVALLAAVIISNRLTEHRRK
ncbi:MAG: hypothetical protein JKY41_14325 [Rhodobacteraceae bacterium]|nr:hypothetical protein [Paracoccaceae bacterium]